MKKFQRSAALVALVGVLFCSTGCQYISEDIDEWPADMFNAPFDGPLLVTIPTWLGSGIGAVAGAGMLPLSWMAGFFVDSFIPEVYASEQEEGPFVVHDGYDIAVLPMMGMGYLVGIATGTPFFILYYPFEVAANAITGTKNEGRELDAEFRERHFREEREHAPVNFPGG